MVPDSLMARPVDNLVRCHTGHMSEELHSHLAWVTTKQSLSILTLVPCEDKPWVFKQNRPPSKQPESGVIEVIQTERLWIHIGHLDADPRCSFLEGHRSALLSPSANPVTLKWSLKARKGRLANCFLLKQKIWLRKNLQLISFTPSSSIPESFLF